MGGHIARTSAMSPDTIKYYEGLLTTYTENIRTADFKSNIILFFLAISIPTVAAFREQFPFHLPFFLLLLLPLSAIVLLVLAIYPRFVATPGFPFLIKRSVSPDDFVPPPDDDQELLALFRVRCAALAKILYWKTFLFRIALGACLIYLAALFILAASGVFFPLPIEVHSP